MKFDDIVDMIEKIKDPYKKKEVLVKVISVLKKQLGIVNEMWQHLDMSEEMEDGESGEGGD